MKIRFIAPVSSATMNSIRSSFLTNDFFRRMETARTPTKRLGQTRRRPRLKQNLQKTPSKKSQTKSLRMQMLTEVRHPREQGVQILCCREPPMNDAVAQKVFVEVDTNLDCEWTKIHYLGNESMDAKFGNGRRSHGNRQNRKGLYLAHSVIVPCYGSM